jgi:hypothetical protein
LHPAFAESIAAAKVSTDMTTYGHGRSRNRAIERDYALLIQEGGAKRPLAPMV